MIELTSEAKTQVKKLLTSRGKVSAGIKIGISTKGCSGLSYTLEFVDKVDKSDEKIITDDFDIYIDSKAVLFLIGTKMDYIKDDLQSGFQFSNPNEKGRCGCGESFHV